MTFNQVLKRLKSKSNPAAVRGMARFGITAAKAAQELHGLSSPGARWIASDALRELETPAVQRRLKT
jgi:hypothetical protein